MHRRSSLSHTNKPITWSPLSLPIGRRCCAACAAPGFWGLVVGVDPSDSMIEYARRKAASIRNCEFHVGAAEALPFPGDHFDVVVSSLVLHHLPEDLRLRALEELRRVLPPGGGLLVAEARRPRHGVLGLLARLHGYDRRAQAVSDLNGMIADADFDQIQSGEAPPWLRYVLAMKSDSNRPKGHMQ